MSFQEQLKRHISFIKRSCESYDTGDKTEALRIAVSLRVLFHDTMNSISLLKHLNIKRTLRFSSTIGTGKNHTQLEGKFMIYIPVMISPRGVSVSLDRAGRSVLCSADEWWNEVVMAQDGHFSRKDIVLSAANQDGGAHVDANPNKKTIELKEGIGTLTIIKNGLEVTEELTDHHFPLLRQFGHEVLKCEELLAIAVT